MLIEQMGRGIYGIEARAQTYYNKPLQSSIEVTLRNDRYSRLTNPRRWTPARPTRFIIVRAQGWCLPVSDE